MRVTASSLGWRRTVYAYHTQLEQSTMRIRNNKNDKKATWLEDDRGDAAAGDAGGVVTEVSPKLQIVANGRWS